MDVSAANGQSAKPGQFRYSRVVVKLGTNVLTGGGEGLDLLIMGGLVAQLSEMRRSGMQVLVVTSGAIAAGREALKVKASRTRKDVPFKQMLAAVGQGRLMQYYQELFEADSILVAQALITKGDLDDREKYLNVRNTLEGLLDLGVVPIINENDVVDIQEIGQVVFGDNDNLSANVANLVDADLLVILSDIDGLYTSDPRKDSKAKLIHRVDRIDRGIEALAGGVGSSRGRGGMVTKIQAAKLATACGVQVVIASGHAPDVLLRLAAGEDLGTLFSPTTSKMDSRRRWMLSGIGAKGRIVIDDGAATALAVKNGSLLPAGVQSLEGDFGRGDLVKICDGRGIQLACGLTNYSAAELAKIKGVNSADISRMLGYKYGDEVVHRNDLVTFGPIREMMRDLGKEQPAHDHTA